MLRAGAITLAFTLNTQAAMLNTKTKKAAEQAEKTILKNVVDYMQGKQEDNVGDFIACTVCQASAATLDSYLTDRKTLDSIEAEFRSGCEALQDFQILNSTVCSIVKHMGDQMVPSLADFLLAPDYACSNRGLN